MYSNVHFSSCIQILILEIWCFPLIVWIEVGWHFYWRDKKRRNALAALQSCVPTLEKISAKELACKCPLEVFSFQTPGKHLIEALGEKSTQRQERDNEIQSSQWVGSTAFTKWKLFFGAYVSSLYIRLYRRNFNDHLCSWLRLILYRILYRLHIWPPFWPQRSHLGAPRLFIFSTVKNERLRDSRNFILRRGKITTTFAKWRNEKHGRFHGKSRKNSEIELEFLLSDKYFALKILWSW